MMCVEVINMNDETLNTILNPRDNFSLTLMEEVYVSLNQSSSFIYTHMNEAIED